MNGGHPQFQVYSQWQIFKKLLIAILIYSQGFLPEICWEEGTEKIYGLLEMSETWGGLNGGLPYYLLDYGDCNCLMQLHHNITPIADNVVEWINTDGSQ